ncbi:MAG TPA: hypothetical protein VGE78_01135 [Agromyces sp.]
MGRLLVFLGTIAVLLGAVAALDRWVDPTGIFYEPGALRAALATDPPCLVSRELVGSSYFPFKEQIFRSRPTTTFVVGSSRVLKIRSRPGERTFANVGFPGIGPEILPPLFRDLVGPRKLTAYVGVEFFWFNPSYEVVDYRPSFRAQAENVLGWSTFRSSVDTIRAAPYVLRHRWRREQVGSRCVIGRSDPTIAWAVDGSRVYSFELVPNGYRPPRQTFDDDLQTLRAGYYRDFGSFDEQRVRDLDEALTIAQRAGWKVVGFAPPDPTQYVRLFSTAPQTARWWRRWKALMPQLFARHGFRWLDLSDVSSVPCAQDAFVDAGFHTTAACSDRIRADLDRAAAQG